MLKIAEMRNEKFKQGCSVGKEVYPNFKFNTKLKRYLQYGYNRVIRN